MHWKKNNISSPPKLALRTVKKLDIHSRHDRKSLLKHLERGRVGWGERSNPTFSDHSNRLWLNDVFVLRNGSVHLDCGLVLFFLPSSTFFVCYYRVYGCYRYECVHTDDNQVAGWS